MALARAGLVLWVAAGIAYPDQPGACHGCVLIAERAKRRERAQEALPERLAELEAWRWGRLRGVRLGEDATPADREELRGVSEEYLTRYAALEPGPSGVDLWRHQSTACLCPGRAAPLTLDGLAGRCGRRPALSIPRRIRRAYAEFVQAEPASRR